MKTLVPLPALRAGIEISRVLRQWQRFVLPLLVVIGMGASVAGQDAQWSFDVKRLGLISQASVLLDKKVKDNEQKKLGNLEDLLLDLPSGQVVAVVVSGAHRQVIPIPARKFSFASKYQILLDTNKQTFLDAPRLNKRLAGSSFGKDELRPSFLHFGRQLPEQTTNACAFSSAVAVLSLSLIGSANEPLGRVKDVMVDVPAGRVIYLVIEPTPGTAGPSDLYVVPPVSVQVDTAHQALRLSLNQATFLAGPRFPKEFWTDMVFPELAVAVRKQFGVSEAAASGDIAGAAQVPGASGAAGAGRSDQELTQAVLAEIFRDNRGMVVLNVAVTTRQGRVTLNGQVKDEKQKQLLLAAAARAAGAGNVEDQIRTRKGAKAAQT